jgi:hypothetical protein
LQEVLLKLLKWRIINRVCEKGRKRTMSFTQRDENLLVVVAVEEYARRHGISAHETLGLFLKYGITESIRQCYETLHTQEIYECVSFAEDILNRRAAS